MRRAGKRHGAAITASRDYGDSDWDEAPPEPALIDALRAMSRYQVLFGGNYFALPPARCWLVWDKLNGQNDYADCELAWTNLDKPVRRIVWQWHGMIRQGKEDRYHPTQKPEGVMAWALSHVPGETILDPYMGSGSTGVACVNMGRKFIGIEVDRRYFDIACKRIEGAYSQIRLFDDLEQHAPGVKQSDFGI